MCSCSFPFSCISEAGRWAQSMILHPRSHPTVYNWHSTILNIVIIIPTVFLFVRYPHDDWTVMRRRWTVFDEGSEIGFPLQGGVHCQPRLSLQFRVSLRAIVVVGLGWGLYKKQCRDHSALQESGVPWQASVWGGLRQVTGSSRFRSVLNVL